MFALNNLKINNLERLLINSIRNSAQSLTFKFPNIKNSLVPILFNSNRKIGREICKCLLADIEYHQEVYPIRVSIYETYNPGSVIRIWARNSNNQWCQLWSGPPQRVPHKPRIFSPPLQLCSFKTKMLRLEFNHSLLDYYTELDAVLLIGTTELILPHVGFKNRSLSALLRELGGTGSNSDDIHNLTPDHTKSNKDLAKLKTTLHKHCVLYKRYLRST